MFVCAKESLHFLSLKSFKQQILGCITPAKKFNQIILFNFISRQEHYIIWKKPTVSGDGKRKEQMS